MRQGQGQGVALGELSRAPEAVLALLHPLVFQPESWMSAGVSSFQGGGIGLPERLINFPKCTQLGRIGPEAQVHSRSNQIKSRLNGEGSRGSLPVPSFAP